MTALEVMKQNDGVHASAERIIAYCDSVASNEPRGQTEPSPAASAATPAVTVGHFNRYEREIQRGGGRLAL